MIVIGRCTILTLAVGLLLGSAVSRAEGDALEKAVAPGMLADESLVPPPAEVLADDVRVTPRSKQLASYPCMECHQHVTPRRGVFAELKQPHRTMTFEHMRTVRLCSHCHPAKAYDELRLLDGTRISFDESYRVCGQCHAEKFRDWNLNIHGKQIGSWRSDKVRTSCVVCHPAHDPRFPQMKADAPPPRPAFGVSKEGH